MDMRLKTVIADDQEAALMVLSIYINKFFDNIELVGKAKNGDDLMKIIEKEKPHLAIVDINMPGKNGFEVIEQCKKKQPNLMAIFITGIEKYAIQAFDIKAVDYIVKPMSIERFKEGIASAVMMRRMQIETQYAWEENSKKITVRDKEDTKIFCSILLQEILYVESVKNSNKKVIVHTSNNEYMIFDSLANVLKKLGEEDFMLTHRSYITNIRKIKSARKTEPRLTELSFMDSEKVGYVSATFLPQFKEKANDRIEITNL